MSYDDGRVACGADSLVIRRYYFPFGDKRVPYGTIKDVRRRPMTLLRGKWRIWGSGDFLHWLNYDPARPRKSAALFIHLTGKTVVPVITPDNPDAVTAELASHGVPVTAG